MSRTFSRRTFLAQAAALTASLSLPRTAAAAKSPGLPMIAPGNLKVGRMLLGSNPFFGTAHVSKKDSNEMTAFFTKDKVMEVLDEAFTPRFGLHHAVGRQDTKIAITVPIVFSREMEPVHRTGPAVDGSSGLMFHVPPCNLPAIEST